VSGRLSRLTRVSDSREPTPPQSETGAEAEEQVRQASSDALPVLASETYAPLAPLAGADAELDRAGAMMPAVQAAAVAAGGFVAGAAVLGLVHRRQRRAQLAKGRRARRLGPSRPVRRRASGQAVELVQIVGSRSLLLDVHLLGGPSDR
jgi:hypothetical protein